MSSPIISNGDDVHAEENGQDKRDPSQEKPMIPEDFIKDIVLRLYGINVIGWKELNAYDDKNYHIQIDPSINNNKYIDRLHQPGYVLKVLNSNDSKNPAIIESQHKLLICLHRKGLPVQEPVYNLYGKTYSVEKVPDEYNSNQYNGPYIFQLLKYITGDMIVRRPYYPKTLYNTGKFAGKIHKALKDFDCQFFKDRIYIWNLKELHTVSGYTFVVKDEDNLEVVNNVMKAFKEEVVPLFGRLNQGYIHGDMNEQNILVGEVTDDNSSCDVKAFIDFMDMTYSYTVFDIAILIAYMSIDSQIVDQLDVGGHILAGYLTELPLNEAERDVLQICICGRLVQSLVLGAYSFHMNPQNSYVMTTAKRGWPLLRKYWQTSKSELHSRWDKILNSYRE